ncbi:MAG: hypothetical protein U0R24_03250 [Solirubrobacterales bacterium]
MGGVEGNWTRRWAILVGLCVLPLLSPPDALATYPGRNGPILAGKPFGDLTAVDPESGQSWTVAEDIADFGDVTADGRTVVFVREDPSAPIRRSIFTASIEGGGEHQVTQFGGPFATRSTISPDGSRVVFDGVASIATPLDFALHSIDRDGTGLTPLLASKGATLAHFSPEGDRMVIQQAAPHYIPHLGLTDMNPDVFTIRSDGSMMRPVIATVKKEMQPSWSPDGRRIVYVGQNRKSIPGEDWDNDMFRTAIYTVRLNGRDKTRISPYSKKGSRTTPFYSPDGEQIVYSKDDELWVMDADGRHPRPVPGATKNMEFPIAWAPAG